jgi:hypothetical protein
MRFTQTCVVLAVLGVPALASAQIKEPGNHARYSAELEPHLIVQWNNYDYSYGNCANDGFGPGFRATIPFLDNGPIPKINNNMGIGFGLDWAHSGRNRRCGYYNNGYGVSADVWTLPVVVQWNFFLLPKISVFGEGGLVLQHYRVDRGVPCNNGDFCDNGSFTDNGWDASFSLGGRFLVSDSVGFLVRLGYPYFSAGVSILL